MPRLELDLTVEKDRLNVNPSAGVAPGGNSAKKRSPSEASQGSIGDFYDAYYRQSVMAQRASVASQTLGINSKSVGVGAGAMEMLGVGFDLGGITNGPGGGSGRSPSAAGGMNATAGQGRRPPPMNFSRGGVGFNGMNPPETIVEMPSPALSTMMHRERFPARI